MYFGKEILSLFLSYTSRSLVAGTSDRLTDRLKTVNCRSIVRVRIIPRTMRTGRRGVSIQITECARENVIAVIALNELRFLSPTTSGNNSSGSGLPEIGREQIYN